MKMSISSDQILVLLVEKDLEIRQLKQMVHQLSLENSKLKAEQIEKSEGS